MIMDIIKKYTIITDQKITCVKNNNVHIYFSQVTN